MCIQMTYKATSDGDKRLSSLHLSMLLGIVSVGAGLLWSAWAWQNQRRRRLFMVPQRTIEKITDLLASSEVEDFLSLYDVSTSRGFIPREDPLERLAHPELQQHESLVQRLPALLRSGQQARRELRSLPVVEAIDHLLVSEGERRRALLVFSALAQAYIWGGGDDVTPLDRLPACLAVPLHRLARRLETAPILSHMSICLYNWARIDASQPSLTVRNLRTTLSFTGDANEAYFHLNTLQIEATGGPAIASLDKARRISVHVLRGDVPAALLPAALESVTACLHDVHSRMLGMTEALASLPRGVDPAFFYHRFRPYLSGWKGNPTLPQGVVFEGVGWWGRRRQRYSGGSAAQSSLIGALDLYLGIDHRHGRGSPSYPFLRAMRAYMPRQHARFLEDLEATCRSQPHLSIRELARTVPESHSLRQAYDACLSALAEFRTKHLGIVTLYILSQQRTAADGSAPPPPRPEGGGSDAAAAGRGLEKAAGGKGTGGQDLLTFLRPLRDETLHRRAMRST